MPGHLLHLTRVNVTQPSDRDGLAAIDQALDVMRHDSTAADDSQPHNGRLLGTERVDAAERSGRGQDRRSLAGLLEKLASRCLGCHGLVLSGLGSSRRHMSANCRRGEPLCRRNLVYATISPLDQLPLDRLADGPNAPCAAGCFRTMPHVWRTRQPHRSAFAGGFRLPREHCVECRKAVVASQYLAGKALDLECPDPIITGTVLVR